MATLTIRVSDEQKRLIKTRAAFEGKTITDFVLESTGAKKQGTMHQALKDVEEGNVFSYESIEELFEDLDTTWEEAQNEV